MPGMFGSSFGATEGGGASGLLTLQDIYDAGVDLSALTPVRSFDTNAIISAGTSPFGSGWTVAAGGPDNATTQIAGVEYDLQDIASVLGADVPVTDGELSAFFRRMALMTIGSLGDGLGMAICWVESSGAGGFTPGTDIRVGGATHRSASNYACGLFRGAAAESFSAAAVVSRGVVVYACAAPRGGASAAQAELVLAQGGGYDETSIANVLANARVHAMRMTENSNTFDTANDGNALAIMVWREAAILGTETAQIAEAKVWMPPPRDGGF